MKQQLRLLTAGTLAHLAFVLGVLKNDQPGNAEELITLVADYCADYRLSWSDLISRFTFLQSSDARKEIMTPTTDQTGTPRANSRTKRLSPLRDTNPVSDLQSHLKGLSSPASRVVSALPHTYAIIALQVEKSYYRDEVNTSTNEEDRKFNQYVHDDIARAIQVLQHAQIHPTKEITPE